MAASFVHNSVVGSILVVRLRAISIYEGDILEKLTFLLAHRVTDLFAAHVDARLFADVLTTGEAIDVDRVTSLVDNLEGRLGRLVT